MASSKRIGELRTKLRAPDLKPLLDELDAVDDAIAVTAIMKQLDASFVRYAKLVGAKQKVTSIKFYWAGAEVAPYVPSDVMGNLYAGAKLLLDSCGGFTPIPLPILAAAADDSDDIADHESFDELRELFLARSIELATRAIEKAAARKAFSTLATSRPFVFTGAPGHDEDKLVLVTLK